MLRRLYDWTLNLAGRPTAELWLALIAFVESSIFLVPADVLFVPMAVARPERAYRYAIVATAFSVLGGIAGWYLGHYAFEAVARPILEFYHKYDDFQRLAQSTDRNAVLLLLITSGLAHLPPIKVVTILSGALDVNLGIFILSALAARGIRFMALAWLLRRYGDEIRHFVERRLGQVAGGIALAIILLFAAARFL